MAAARGVISRPACQGLLQAVARPRARSRLLICKSRWISSEEHESEEHERPAKTSSIRPEDVKEMDRWRLHEFRDPFETIDQSSYVACREPVSLVDTEIQRVCSWNEASGSRQAIHVPGESLGIFFFFSSTRLHLCKALRRGQTNRD